MSGGIAGLVSSGPLLLAIPVAAAAGAVTFLSPCVLPLVPGYLSYITGMSGASVAVGADSALGPDSAAGAASGSFTGPTSAVQTRAAAPQLAAVQPSRRRAVTGTVLFVLGFSALFTTYGLAFGGIGLVLQKHQLGLTQVLGAVLIVLGLLFAGAFDRFSLAGRIVKPSFRPRAGLASAPMLGVLFGLGWSPCIGPTLSAVLTLGATSGTAVRGALLAFVYGLGIGIPFLIVAVAFERGMALFGFAKRHGRLITRVGGVLLIGVGLLEVTGVWGSVLIWMQVHWISSYVSPF